MNWLWCFYSQGQKTGGDKRGGGKVSMDGMCVRVPVCVVRCQVDRLTKRGGKKDFVTSPEMDWDWEMDVMPLRLDYAKVLILCV